MTRDFRWLDAEIIRAWQRIFRDTVIVMVGTFMLLYETVAVTNANVEILAAALACYGLPPLLRFEFRRDDQNGNGKQQ